MEGGRRKKEVEARRKEEDGRKKEVAIALLVAQALAWGQALELAPRLARRGCEYDSSVPATQFSRIQGMRFEERTEHYIVQ